MYVYQYEDTRQNFYKDFWCFNITDIKKLEKIIFFTIIFWKFSSCCIFWSSQDIIEPYTFFWTSILCFCIHLILIYFASLSVSNNGRSQIEDHKHDNITHDEITSKNILPTAFSVLIFLRATALYLFVVINFQRQDIKMIKHWRRERKKSYRRLLLYSNVGFEVNFIWKTKMR